MAIRSAFDDNSALTPSGKRKHEALPTPTAPTKRRDCEIVDAAVNSAHPSLSASQAVSATATAPTTTTTTGAIASTATATTTASASTVDSGSRLGTSFVYYLFFVVVGLLLFSLFVVVVVLVAHSRKQNAFFIYLRVAALSVCHVTTADRRTMAIIKPRLPTLVRNVQLSVQPLSPHYFATPVF